MSAQPVKLSSAIAEAIAGAQIHSTGPVQPSFADPAAIELALGAMGVGVFEYDPIAGAQRLSDRCREILGLGADDVLSVERIFALLHPDDCALTAAACDSLKPESVGHFSIEPRVIRPDGTIRWVQISGRTVFQEGSAGRRAFRSYGTMVDVTERRQTERRLYERESQLSTFIDGAPASIAMFDREMRYLEVSRQHAQEIGFAPGDLIGRCAYDVFPNMPERWKAVHTRCLNGASERCDVDVVVRSSGTTDWLRWEVHPWYRADQTVGGLILFSELITQRLQAQHLLHESEARLELAVRAGALGIYDYNLSENKTTWDCRVRQLWGISADETVTFETFLAGLHPEDRAPTLKALEESLGPDSNGTHAAEYRVVHRLDGSTRWISSTGTVFFEGGRAIRLVGIVQDITDRKRSELALAQSAEDLRQADERKDAFLATLSHELRNPLAPIRNAAHILGFPNLKDEQVTWARQVIQRQTTHMASLLNDLLDVARITRGKLVLKKQEVTLVSIVESAVEAARPLLDEKQHGLQLSLPDDALCCEVDPLRMSQVLSNLLGNAAKYTEPQGRIELAAWAANAALFVSVKDNGIGIPAEALDQIFAMFWQVDGARDQYGGGLGIGLAFVKNVVELHGGSIEARSEGPGHGSEFRIKLPLAVRPPREARILSQT
jgi:PAS domain S-box-containing protein